MLSNHGMHTQEILLHYDQTVKFKSFVFIIALVYSSLETTTDSYLGVHKSELILSTENIQPASQYRNGTCGYHINV
jgi:hypothetical protein